MKFKLCSLICLYALNGTLSYATETCDVLRSEINESKFDWAQDEALWIYLINNNYTTTPEQPAGFFFSELPLNNKLDTIYRKSELVLKLSENVAKNWYPNKLPHYYELNPPLAKSSSCFRDFFKPFCTDSEHYKCLRNFKYRSIDGYCNNINRPKDGAAQTAYASFAYQYYYDSIQKFRRSYKSDIFLPNSRELVNKFFNKCIKRDIFLEYGPSVVGVMFGQLVTHDVSFKPFPQRKQGGHDLQCCKADFSGPLPKNLRHPVCKPQVIPKDDAFFGPKNMTCMNFLRTQAAYDNECVLSSRKQLNSQTSFLDLSSVYGVLIKSLMKLRTLKNGLLRLEGNKVFPLDSSGAYMFADIRTQQTPILSLLHSLYLREHNRLAKKILALKPNWNDETIFQEARRWNIAQYQHIVYNWIKIFIDRKYRDLGFKDSKCSPFITTTNEFAHSAFRDLHTLSPQKIEYYDESGTKVDEITLSDSFVGPFNFLDKPTQYNNLVRAFFYQKTNFNGCLKEIINLLFKNSDGIGIDLLSMDISRTDDHGIQPYYVYAWMCHRKRIKKFEDLGPEISDHNINLLKKIYRSVYDIHLYVGSKLETRPNEYKFGPTTSCIVNEQFYRYKHADPYFYDSKNNINPFTSEQLAELKKTSFERLLCNNSNITEVAKNAFIAVSKKNILIPCSQVPKPNIKY